MIILIIHIIVSYEQNISLIFYVKMNLMSGCDIRLVFTFPPKDNTLQYKNAYTSEITFISLLPGATQSAWEHWVKLFAKNKFLYLTWYFSSFLFTSHLSKNSRNKLKHIYPTNWSVQDRDCSSCYSDHRLYISSCVEFCPVRSKPAESVNSCLACPHACAGCDEAKCTSCLPGE